MASTVEMDKDVCRVRVQGEMTIYTALELKQELVSCLRRAPQLELDLSQVNEMDSAGLQLLILLKRETAKQDGRLTLTAHSPAVTEAIDAFNMAGYFGDPIVLHKQHARSRQQRTAK